MTTAVIVEDEPALADELAEVLHNLWPELVIIKRAPNGVEALQCIFQDKPDIAFLDIQIPDPNGLEVARIVRDACHIVFVTAYDAHALEACEKGAIDYILKPISQNRLATTVQRLQQRLNHAPLDYSDMVGQVQSKDTRPHFLRWITASHGQSLRLITIDEVIFFQADHKFTRVVLAESEVLIKKSLKELLSELDPDQFWQTHRSTVVNALEIASIEPNLAGNLAIKLKSRREQLPVSEAFVRKFRQM